MHIHIVYILRMIMLFTGDWDKEATQALLRQIHRVKQENPGKKTVRIGYSGWEKITENLNEEGHKYSIYVLFLSVIDILFSALIKFLERIICS